MHIVVVICFFFLIMLLLNPRNNMSNCKFLDFWSLGKKRRLLGSFLKGGIRTDGIKCYTRGYSFKLVCQIAATIDSLMCGCDLLMSFGKPNCALGVLLEICTV